jgi:hypothetical protein
MRSSSPNTPPPTFWGPPLVGCLRLFIQYIRSYPPRLKTGLSIRNMRSRHAVLTSAARNMIIIWIYVGFVDWFPKTSLPPWIRYCMPSLASLCVVILYVVSNSLFSAYEYSVFPIISVLIYLPIIFSFFSPPPLEPPPLNHPFFAWSSNLLYFKSFVFYNKALFLLQFQMNGILA